MNESAAGDSVRPSGAEPMLDQAAKAVLLIAFDGTAVPDWVAQLDGLGGVCLFGVNTPDPAAAARLVAQLRVHHPDLVIAIDEEGGDVTRLQAAVGSDLPAACAYGTINDTTVTAAAGQALAAVLAACDIDLALSPVLDLASDGVGTVLGARPISADPHITAHHGVAFIQGLHSASVAACAKHAPGHGATSVDSHLGVPTVDADLTTLHSRELVPFRAAISSDVDAVMLAHLQVPALAPSGSLTSLDPAVPMLLREQGFDGAILTDALDMGAVLERTSSIGEACVQALLAGVDLLCLGSPSTIDETAVTEVIAAIVGAVSSGRLRRERLNDAASRVRALRRRRDARPDLTRSLAELETLGESICERAASTRGDVTVAPGSALIDLRFRAAYAASSSAAVAPALLSEHLDLSPEPGRARTVLLTKDRSDAVLQRLSELPDAVVLHTGHPDTAPPAANLITVPGAGRSSIMTAIARMQPRPS